MMTNYKSYQKNQRSLNFPMQEGVVWAVEVALVCGEAVD